MMGALRRWTRRRRVAGWQRRCAPSDPAFARYLERFEPLDERTPLEDVRFVVVDIESTGLDPARDRILTLAGVAVEGLALRPGESLELVVAHDDVGADAAPIHGLVRADLTDGEEESRALAQLLDLLGNAVFVAHHAAFDARILDVALRRHGGPLLLNDVLDTEALVRRLTLGPMPRETTERFGLDAVAARYGLETEARHTAAGDALLTAELLIRLLVMARRAGLERLGRVLR